MHSASNARKRKNSSVERDSSLASSAGSSVHNHTPLQERPGSSEPHQNELHNIQEPRRPRKVEMMSQRRINQIRSAQKSYRERQALHLKELEAKVRLYETALKESDNLDTLSWIQRLASLEAENECLKKAQLVNSQQAKSAGTCNSCLMERDKYVQANMRISELEVRLRIAESAVRQNGYHGDEDDNDAAVEFRDVANSEVPQRPHLAPCYSEIGTNDCHGRQNALNRAANDPAELLPRFADRTASLDQPVTRPDSLIFSILSSIKNVHLAEPGGKSEGISSFLHNPIFMEWVQSIPVPPLSSSSLLAYKFSEGCAGARYGSVDFEWARQQLSEIPSLHGAQFIISDFINLLYSQVITTNEALLAKYVLKSAVAKAILSIQCSDDGNLHAAERVFSSIDRQFGCYDSHVCMLLNARQLQDADKPPDRALGGGPTSASREQFVDFCMAQVPPLRPAPHLVAETGAACALMARHISCPGDGGQDGKAEPGRSSPAACSSGGDTNGTAWRDCMQFLRVADLVNRLLLLCETEDERAQVVYAVGVLRAAEAEVAAKQAGIMGIMGISSLVD